MKILVCGGRNYEKYAEFNSIMKMVQDKVDVSMIIQGGAKGADHLALEWADKKVIPCLNVPADWDKYGKSAGFKRNAKMLEYEPDMIVAFTGGVGTKMMMALGISNNVKVVDVERYLVKVKEEK